MSEVGTIFEIWIYARDNWLLAELGETEGQAVADAQALLTKPENVAAKVLRVTFSEKSQDYREAEAFTGGIAPTISEEPESEDYQPFCTAPEDFYNGDAFRIIGRLLKQPLQQWKITVPELMYGARYLKKLNDTGMLLQGAVQKTAIAQCQQTDHKTSERVLELYDMTTAALGDLKQASDEGFPKIADKDLAALVQEVSDLPQPRKMLMMALCEHFTDYGSLDEKYDQVFSFLAKYDAPEIVAAMDTYLAGYLASDKNIVDLLGEPVSLGASLVDFINFVKGNFIPRGARAERHELLNRLFAQDRLPECRKILMMRIETELKGPKSLVQGNEFENIMFHANITQALSAPGDGAAIDSRFLDILDVRCAKILGRERMAKVIGPIERVADRILKLLTMCREAPGPHSRNLMARFFLPILDLRSNEKELANDDQPVMVRLKALRDLQKQVEEVGFFEVHARRISVRLDDIAAGVLRDGNVVQNILAQQDNRVAKLTALLKLLGADILTDGEASALVKAEAKAFLGDDQFMAELIPSSAEKSEQIAILKNFYDMLSKAGFAA